VIEGDDGRGSTEARAQMLNFDRRRAPVGDECGGVQLANCEEQCGVRWSVPDGDHYEVTGVDSARSEHVCVRSTRGPDVVGGE
jgi:hypothetical protein